MRFLDVLLMAGTLAGLVVALSGLYGFTTDLIAGMTASGSSLSAPVVERATDAGRFWGLMSAWLIKFVGGAFAFVFCGRAWHARHALRASEHPSCKQPVPNTA
jgi:hypothetical protein